MEGTAGGGPAAPDPSAGIVDDVTQLQNSLQAIASYQANMRQHIASLEAQIAQNPSAPVSSLDLTALKAELDTAAAEAKKLETAPEPDPAPTGGTPGGSGEPPAPTGTPGGSGEPPAPTGDPVPTGTAPGGSGEPPAPPQGAAPGQ